MKLHKHPPYTHKIIYTTLRYQLISYQGCREIKCNKLYSRGNISWSFHSFFQGHIGQILVINIKRKCDHSLCVCLLEPPKTIDKTQKVGSVFLEHCS